jgi:hypothetical protein
MKVFKGHIYLFDDSGFLGREMLKSLSVTVIPLFR